MNKNTSTVTEEEHASSGTRRLNVTRLVELAVFTALILLLTYTPLGYMPTPWGISITLIVIPVAAGSILLGPAAGAFLGFVFGMTSVFNAFSGRSAFTALLVSVSIPRSLVVLLLDRIVVGIVPGLVYRLLRRFRLSVPLACLLTPFCNTALWCVMLFLLFHGTCLGYYGNYHGNGGFSLLYFMIASVAFNGLLEIITCTVIGTAVVKALQKTVNVLPQPVPQHSRV